MRDLSQLLYTDEHTRTISFPLGGLGTGSIGLAGNGALVDWEIFNRPAKGRHNGFSHFAITAIEDDTTIDARVLHGDLQPPYEGSLGATEFYSGFGWGPYRETLAGLPHFAATRFTGTYPIAHVEFVDRDFPGRVTLEALNPFIPHDDRSSGMPVAMFEYTVTNTTDRQLVYQLSGTATNPFAQSQINRYEQQNAVHRIALAGAGTDPVATGDLCIASDAESVRYQEHWYGGAWFDELEVYWRDLTNPAGFTNRAAPQQAGGMSSGGAMTATLAGRVTCPPGQSRRVRFVLAWYVPLCRRFWDRQPVGFQERFTPEQERLMAQPWRNWYATVWDSSAAVAQEALTEWDRLSAQTRAFRDALFSSSLPPAAMDAVAGPLSVLKSATVLRLEDGSFYGWEGTGTDVGSCEGSCTHVWSYTQALAFLFPQLERSMRTVEYRYNLNPDGAMAFRTMLPLGSPRWPFRPCVDGQFGTVLRVYREWKIGADGDWLRSIWPAVRDSIAFAWSPDNKDAWDPQATGVITGRQHHTLDMELFGANSWLTGMYLAALQAAAEIAAVMDDDAFAARCRSIYERGRKRLNDELFNGSYYCQRLDLQDKQILAQFDNGSGDMFGNAMSATYWDAEHGQIKYQLGDGISIDHALGQWHAGLYGLEPVFDRAQLRTSLQALYAHNTKRTMRRHANPCRVFSLNGEGGLVMCAWPEDAERPAIPIPYAQETMTGFEYAAAALMIQTGMVDEGLEIVTAIRERYDGAKRNPWNEIECGSNYARAMASYSILLSLSGFIFDAPARLIGFLPRVAAPWRFFWSALGSWGSAVLTDDRFELRIAGQPIEIAGVVLPNDIVTRVAAAQIDGHDVDIAKTEATVNVGRGVTAYQQLAFDLDA